MPANGRSVILTDAELTRTGDARRAHAARRNEKTPPERGFHSQALCRTRTGDPFLTMEKPGVYASRRQWSPVASKVPVCSGFARDGHDAGRLDATPDVILGDAELTRSPTRRRP